jgi:DNA-binding CsgD family transcriptional regulator
METDGMKTLADRIAALLDGNHTAREIADKLRTGPNYVRQIAARLQLPFKRDVGTSNPKPETATIMKLADGTMTCRQIAEKVGLTPSQVHNRIKHHGGKFRPMTRDEIDEVRNAATIAALARRTRMWSTKKPKPPRKPKQERAARPPSRAELVREMTEQQAEDFNFLTRDCGYTFRAALEAVKRLDLRWD